MYSPHALPLPPSAMSLQGLDTHVATGMGARREPTQTSLAQLAPGSALGSHAAIDRIRVREWPTRSACAQFAAPRLDDGHAAAARQAILLQLKDSETRDRLDEHLCSFWDTRKLLFMHPHDMAAHGLAEGDSVLVSAAAPALPTCQRVRLRVVPYDLPRGTARGYFQECAALVTPESASAEGSPGIRVRVASTAH